MPRGELHIPLSVRYAHDEKLEGVSRDARLLYIDAVCMAKELMSDGFISDVQIVKLAFPAAAVKAKRWASELVASGAFERLDGLHGYVIPGYLKRNPSRAQVLADKGDASEAGIRGNHERWHKNRISPNCPLCPPPEGDRVDVGVPDGDPIGFASGSDRVSSPETETETETSNPPTPIARDGGRSCTRHARKRRGCKACETPANPTVQLGPPCGECSPSRRLEDADGNDLGPCPKCHPSGRRLA